VAEHEWTEENVADMVGGDGAAMEDEAASFRESASFMERLGRPQYAERYRKAAAKVAEAAEILWPEGSGIEVVIEGDITELPPAEKRELEKAFSAICGSPVTLELVKDPKGVARAE